jgi:hypothetical protein
MKQRCVNPRNKAFKNYGARGISVCEKWRDSFQSFLDDVGLRPDPKLTIDRINNDGNYEPGNVRWATRSQQNLNTRRRLKLTTDDCHKIALDPRSQRLLAAEYSVARTTICRAKQRGAQAS